MKPFQFLILRYLHDAISGEFVNIGVVVYQPGDFLGVRINHRAGHRLKALFGHVQKSHLKPLLRFVEKRINGLKEEISPALIDRFPNLQALATSVLPADDSALQWSVVKSGMTRNPEEELERLFSRLVLYYETPLPKPHRTDNDVWKEFSASLQKARILHKLTDKLLVAPDFEYRFDHAWKNGAWNLFEPIAFDYEDPDSILDKGNRWLGRGMALSDSKEPHKFWFLVGEPELESHKPVAQKAVNLLCKLGKRVTIVREHEKEAFSAELARQIQEHEHSEPQ